LVPHQTPFRPWYLRSGFFAALAAAIVAWVAAYFILDYRETHLRLTEAVLGTITNEPGVAYVVNDKGEVTIKMGARIHANDTLRVKEGTAKMQYSNEETTVDVMSDTDVKFMNENGAKHLYVPGGTIYCDVDIQPKDKPMTITTPTAKATVVGTSFKLLVSPSTSLNPSNLSPPLNPSPPLPASTRLEVMEGLVKFTRLSDGKMIDVAAGQYATASGSVELAALALPSGIAQVPGLPSGQGNTLTIPVDGKEPKPLTNLYGKVIFEDDFSRGLENWDVVVFGKDGTCEVASPNVAKYVELYKGDPVRPGARVIIRAGMGGGYGIPNVLLGIRSKKAIAAERCVLQMRIDLGGGSGPQSSVIATGIESRNEDISILGDKGEPFGTGNEYDWEFTSSDEQFRQNSLLCRHFGLNVSRGGKYDQQWTSWQSSWYLRATSRKIVFGTMNREMFIEKVTVRELLEEGAGTKAAAGK
jgi:hypothetical protein